MTQKNVKTLSAIILCGGMLLSCKAIDPEEKYELRSPCVANELTDSATHAPCVHRPINQSHLG